MSAGCPGTPWIIWALAVFGGVGVIFVGSLIYQWLFELWEKRR